MLTSKFCFKTNLIKKERKKAAFHGEICGFLRKHGFYVIEFELICFYDYILNRLGFVIDFLSKATLVGFMAGAAIIVSLQQLKGLLGIVHFTSKMQFVPVMSSVFNNRDEVIFSQKGSLYCCFERIAYANNVAIQCAVVLANHCYWLQFLSVSIDNKAYCECLYFSYRNTSLISYYSS